MMLNKKRIKLPLIVFIIMMILCSGIFGYSYSRFMDEQESRMNNCVHLLADDMELSILSRVNILRTAEALIIHSGYENFEDVLGDVVNLPYIHAIIFAPNDIVEDLYSNNNINYLKGKNIQSDLFGGKINIKQSLEYGTCLSGPVIIGDSQVLLGRLPVYLTDNDGNRSYWGVVALGLLYPDILQEVDFSPAIEQGYYLRVWNQAEERDERNIIFESEKKSENNSKMITYTRDIMNMQWSLDVAPVSGSGERAVVALLCIGCLIISLACAFSLYKYLCKRDEKYYEKKAEYDRQYLGVMTLLSSEYSSVYYVYPDSNSVIPYGLSERMQSLFGDSFKKLKYSDACEAYVEKAVKEDNRDTVRELLSSEYIKEQLKNQNSYVRHYQNNESKYCELKCVRVKDQAEEFAVVMGFAEKDKEIRAELDAQDQIKEARQRAEAASVAKSTFLFNMSHDIRTPMNAIMGYTQMALKHSDDPDMVEDCLEKVNISGDHLRRLINDILDVARIENGKIIINESVIDIREINKELHAIISENVNEKKIKFKYQCDIKYFYIYIDRLRASQIMLNVLSNAIKFTPEGGEILCSLTQGSVDNEGKIEHTFIVQDNGCGMSEEFLSHIYEAFVREKSSTVSGVQGSGLGMAITKQLIDAMGGTINIESRVGKGTRVTITIKCRISGNGQKLTGAGNSDIEEVFRNKASDSSDKFKNLFAAIDSAGDTLEEENTMRGKRALVVEDTKLNMEITECILTDEGILVDKAYDGAEAIEKVKSNPPDYYNIILMDVQMPVMNGYEATRIIKSMPEYADIPIVAMTANVFDEDKRTAFQSGMCGHLSKPIDIFEMIETLKEKMR